MNEDSRAKYDTEQRSKEVTDKHIINETISLNEMNKREGEGGGDYGYDCRCGGVYSVAMATAREMSREEEVIVQCDTCSLSIKVINT